MSRKISRRTLLKVAAGAAVTSLLPIGKASGASETRQVTREQFDAACQRLKSDWEQAFEGDPDPIFEFTPAPEYWVDLYWGERLVAKTNTFDLDVQTEVYEITTWGDEFARYVTEPPRVLLTCDVEFLPDARYVSIDRGVLRCGDKALMDFQASGHPGPFSADMDGTVHVHVQLEGVQYGSAI